jgi:endoglucanase
MVPEGLEWASAEDILDDIASVGFNYIRMYAWHSILTHGQEQHWRNLPRGYAIEMVDQVYDRNGTDVPLEVAMISALGYVNGYTSLPQTTTTAN